MGIPPFGDGLKVYEVKRQWVKIKRKRRVLKSSAETRIDAVG